MQKTTQLRLFGSIVILFNFWLVGRYNLAGVPVVVMTFGFAIGYEVFVVRLIKQSDFPTEKQQRFSRRKPPLDEPRPAAPLIPRRSGPPSGASEEELMQHYGITRDNEHYIYGSYRFGQFSNALSHARHAENLQHLA